MLLKIRNILFTCFLLTYVFIIGTYICYYFFHDILITMATNFCLLQHAEMDFLIVLLYGIVEMFAWVGFLIPAVAIHITDRVEKRRAKK